MSDRNSRPSSTFHPRASISTNMESRGTRFITYLLGLQPPAMGGNAGAASAENTRAAAPVGSGTWKSAAPSTCENLPSCTRGAESHGRRHEPQGGQASSAYRKQRGSLPAGLPAPPCGSLNRREPRGNVRDFRAGLPAPPLILATADRAPPR